MAVRLQDQVPVTRDGVIPLRIRTWNDVDLMFLTIVELDENGDGEAELIDLPDSEAKWLLDRTCDQPLILQFPGLLVSYDDIVAGLVDELNRLYLRERSVREWCRADGHDLLAWATKGQAIADDVANFFGEPIGEAVRAVGRSVEDSIRWLDRYINEPPRSLRDFAELETSAHVWAFDELLSATRAAAGPGRLAARANTIAAALQPTVEAISAAGAKVPGADAWKMRANRMGQRIVAGLHDELMATILSKIATAER